MLRSRWEISKRSITSITAYNHRTLCFQNENTSHANTATVPNNYCINTVILIQAALLSCSALTEMNQRFGDGDAWLVTDVYIA